MALPVEMERRILNLKAKRFIDNLTDPDGIDINAAVDFCKPILNKAGFLVTGTALHSELSNQLFTKYSPLLETVFLIDERAPIDETHPHIKEQWEFCKVLLEDLGFAVTEIVAKQEITPTREDIKNLSKSIAEVSPGDMITNINFPYDTDTIQYTISAGGNGGSGVIGSGGNGSGGIVNAKYGAPQVTVPLVAHCIIKQDLQQFHSKDELREMAVRDMMHSISSHIIEHYEKLLNVQEEEDFYTGTIKYKATLKVTPP